MLQEILPLVLPRIWQRVAHAMARARTFIVTIVPAMLASVQVATTWPQDQRGCIPTHTSRRHVLRVNRTPDRSGV